MPLPLPFQKPVIVLLNFGGPRNPEEVAGFLFEILRDPNTLQLPLPLRLQEVFARRIADRRAAETQRQYGEIGGKSPIVEATQAIAEALGRRIAARGSAIPVLTAHRYLPGDAEKTAQAVVELGADAVLTLPLYPHFSYATTGSSLEQFRGALYDAGYCGEIAAYRSFPDTPSYLDAVGERLQTCLMEVGPPGREKVVLCSAHGLPASYVKRGDPYLKEMQSTVAGLRARFSEWRFDLSFQSRVGPAEWLRPYTDEYLSQLAAEGITTVVFLPLSFVNDHIETLYEIGHTYFQMAREQGMTPHLVPAVETHPAFITCLSDAVEEWHQGRGEPLSAEMLPPSQLWRRSGWRVWGLWLLSLIAVVWFTWL